MRFTTASSGLTFCSGPGEKSAPMEAVPALTGYGLTTSSTRASQPFSRRVNKTYGVGTTDHSRCGGSTFPSQTDDKDRSGFRP
jgi:hypothetical protein